MPPKKSKKDEPCYTRTNKGGKQYVTCEGAQKAKAKAKDKKPIPPNSVRAKSRRAAAARKLTTRPTGAGRIETGTLNKGKIIKEAKAKAKKVETVDEAYKRHLKEFSQSKYTVQKLKEMLDNIKGRDKDDYRIHPGMENSDKGAVKAINEILKKSDKPKPKNVLDDPQKTKGSFKISARDMRDLKFRWELWWKKNGFLGGSDYISMPTRVANTVFASQKSLDDKGDREKIFKKLQSLIGDGNTADGTTWKSITKKDLLKHLKI